MADGSTSSQAITIDPLVSNSEFTYQREMPTTQFSLLLLPFLKCPLGQKNLQGSHMVSDRCVDSIGL